ncbi:MAG: dihydropteroate synthase [Acidobacteriota bacterium]
MKLFLRNKFIDLDDPLVMGILNITPDSFSDGGSFLDVDAALEQAGLMIKSGAEIIDVGGESTRPGAHKIDIDEEIDRILPVIKEIKAKFDVLVSVDTSKERVAKVAVLEGGADIVNDISALSFSLNMAETIANLSVPVVLMHIKGTPVNMQNNPGYINVIEEIKEYFNERIDFAVSKGIKREKIIIDPGIGFGKRVEDNIEILKNLDQFLEFELPILVGLSRKSFLGKISREEDPGKREAETITANIISILKGASILRVHNVENCVKSIKILKEFNNFPHFS